MVWITEALVQRIAVDGPASAPDWATSNIEWSLSPRSQTPLDVLCKNPINVNTVFRTDRQRLRQWRLNQHDVSHSDKMSGDVYETMTLIWSSLGNIIIESANMSEDLRREALFSVYRIIGNVHNGGLIPGHVYSYSAQNFSEITVQRPPILHLLSSRILSTLSDAVWRSHSDEIIERAVRQGAQYKDIGPDPPGGRFRLKVRPLGPEVWLEFVLWCCVDGNFPMAGSRIIERLLAETQNPWYAISWSQNRQEQGSETVIDWDKVKLRSGGTVGRIEGYSSEPPFVEMPKRTISAEVVLSLAETHLNTVAAGTGKQEFTFAQVEDSLRKTISFLEPHGLPPSYFDYLAVRGIHLTEVTSVLKPEKLMSWFNTISYLKSLESRIPNPEIEQSLHLNSVVSHSELQVGLLQQSLDGFVQAGDVRRAIDAFSELQQIVDASKLRSIGTFYDTSIITEATAKNSHMYNNNLDFVGSHGQLPFYKLAGFLNLMTNSRQLRLGHWLIYSEDIDGPLIPSGAYHYSCLSTALVRFAILSGDRELVRRLERSSPPRRLRPSVNFLRALCDAHIMFTDFGNAEITLYQLVSSAGGGYSPSNLAHLGAAILKLEVSHQKDASSRLSAAIELANKILAGKYDERKNSFRLQQVTAFMQQISAILRMFQSIQNTNLNSLAASWKHRFHPRNRIALDTRTFNVLLEAIVDTRGPEEGQRMWALFCEDPRYKSPEEWDLDFDFTTRHAVPYVHNWKSVSSREVSISSDPAEVNTNQYQSPLLTRSSPIVRPDLRTLQTIVRAALIPHITSKREDSQISNPRPILRWARQFYEALGSSNEQFEQGLPPEFVGNGDDGALKENRALPDAPRAGTRYRPGEVESQFNEIPHFHDGRRRDDLGHFDTNMP